MEDVSREAAGAVRSTAGRAQSNGDRSDQRRPIVNPSISERATPKIAEIPEHERPLSEQWRIAAKAWVEAEAAAQLLEDLKTTTLEQHKNNLIETEGDMPDSHAERRVKARPEWEKYIRDIVAARREANLCKMKLDWLRMKFSEWQARDANTRAEMRLTR